MNELPSTTYILKTISVIHFCLKKNQLTLFAEVNRVNSTIAQNFKRQTYESHLHISAPIPLPNKSHLPPFPTGQWKKYQQNIENPLVPVRWVSPFSFAVHCTSFLLFWPEPHRPDLSLADLRLFYEHWFFLLKLTPIPTIFLLSSPSWSTKEWLKDYFFTLYNW